MIIKYLELSDFRNYDEIHIDLSPNTNIFFGDNAQGKTNILEAVFLTGTTKSHKGSHDSDIISFGKDYGVIRALFDKNDVEYKIGIQLRKDKRKAISINGSPIKKAADLLGIVNVVLFSPEDLSIIKSGPDKRRRFIDMTLCQVDKEYLFALSSYNKIINQRNKLLKNYDRRFDISDTLNIWDEQLISYGNQVIKKRQDFLNEVENIIHDIHCNLSGNDEKLSIKYKKNINEEEYKDKLKDAKYRHKKGIVCLACIEERNWLLSCGIEHFVIIWDLVVGKHIGLLQGHSMSLLGVKILNGTDQIITGDVGGIFKVWDARDLNLVQTFLIPNSTNKKVRTFCVTSRHKKKIIIGADKVFFFDYDESQEENLCDTHMCTDVSFNEVFNVFITAHMDSIKIWEASTGRLKQVFKSPMKNEISCVKLERRKRKLFIGDVEGELISINILNGLRMKSFAPHKKYVSALDYFSEGKKFMSSSWDGTIKIHDDSSNSDTGLQLFEFSHNVPGKVNGCNYIDFSEELKILACGYENGAVTLINMKSLSSEGTLTEHKNITICKFLEDYPSLVVCDIEGDVHIWSIILTKPKKMMKDCVLKNYSNNENSNQEIYPVKYLCFEKKNNVLFMGDETGFVKAYDINEYINYLKLTTSASKIEYDNYEKNSNEKENPNELEGLKNKLLNSTKNTLKGKANLVIKLSKLVGIKNSMKIKPVLLKEWQAHKNGISALNCYHDPVMYITAGHDLKVHIWDEKFELIGNLTNIVDPNWKLKIDDKTKQQLISRLDIILRKRIKNDQQINFYEALKLIIKFTPDEKEKYDRKLAKKLLLHISKK